MRLFERFASQLIKISERRSPDFIVGGTTNPYLCRWHLIPRNRFFNVYLHHFLRSDEDRALHDHPWASVSIILRGAYLEHLPRKIWRLRKAGNIVIRDAKTAHRIELFNPESWPLVSVFCPYLLDPCWTLFITGPRLRAWGFHCPKGWVPWQDFTAPGAEGEIGKGCE